MARFAELLPVSAKPAASRLCSALASSRDKMDKDGQASRQRVEDHVAVQLTHPAAVPGERDQEHQLSLDARP